MILSYYLSFTTFEHITLDGTIIKAYNSQFNILKMDDINTLINPFTKRKINWRWIKRSSLFSSKIFYIVKKNLNEYEKVEVLKTL